MSAKIALFFLAGVWGFASRGTGAAPAGGKDGVRWGRVLVAAAVDSPASLEIAAAYRRARWLPPRNLLFVDPGKDRLQMPASRFRARVLAPILARWRQGAPRIDYAVFCLGLPYRVDRVSATTALMFGGVDRIRPVQGMFMQERSFESCIPCSGKVLHPATILGAYTVEEALGLIRRSGVHYSAPEQAGVFCLCRGRGPRGVRNRELASLAKLLRRRGFAVVVVPTPSLHDRRNVFFQLTGAARLSFSEVEYRPGAILDNLTSFGGRLLERSRQTSLFEFLRHGGSGGYGTVSEPTNIPTRWATPALPLRYARGFNLMDAYLGAVLDWRYGVVVGDPLLAPMAALPQIEAPKTPVSVNTGRDCRFSFRVREARPGAGIRWVEAWLDDQDRVFSWQPVVPAGCRAQLTVYCGSRRLFQRRAILPRPGVAGGLLERLAGESPDSAVQALWGGKRLNRLLVRLGPEVFAHPGVQTCRVELEMIGPQRGIRVRRIFQPLPVTARCLVFDLGHVPPAPGDRIEMTLGKRGAGVTARSGEGLDAFLERFLRGCRAAFAEFAGPHPRWFVRIARPGPGGRKGRDSAARVLVVQAADSASDATLPLRVRVSRRPGSLFAPRFSGRSHWEYRAVGLAAECVLTPVWPAPELKAAVHLPAGALCPGDHTCLIMAGGSHGSCRFLPVPVTVKGAGPGPALRLRTPQSELGKTCEIQLSGPAEGRPQLFVDGLPYCIWPRGAHRVKATWKLPLISPGMHRLHVEWGTRPAFASLLARRRPLARTPAVSVFLRRPLLSEADFTPKRVRRSGTGPAWVRLHGPYLRGGLEWRAGNRVLPVRRAPDFGRDWLADVSRLPPGAWRLSVRGDPRKEIGGSFPALLRIVPAAGRATRAPSRKGPAPHRRK